MISPGSPRRLQVIHVITTLTTGGAEKQVELLATGSRHDVRVICLFEGGPVAQTLIDSGISVDVLGMAGWHKATAIPRLARILSRHSPDVVHVHLLSGQLWGLPAARLARIPLVISTEHSIMETTIEGRPKTAALRLLYLGLDKLASHVIAVSDATARRMRDWGVRTRGRVTVINPPIDFDALGGADRAAARQEFAIPPDAVVVGAIGRLDPVKRFDQLIRALADRMRAAGLHLLVIGDGTLRPELTELAAELGVAHALHLTGARTDVAQLLDGIDLLVSPSRDETFGMAVVEAVGAGIPVVFAQCPALEDLDLTADWIQKVPTDTDPATELRDLDDAVGRLIAHGLARQAVPAQLLQRYGAAQTASSVDDLYERLIDTGRRSHSRRRQPSDGR